MTSREPPFSNVLPYKLKCVTCSQVQKYKCSEKFRICESSKADDLRKIATFFMDDVYTRTCDLTTNEAMFSADLYYHKTCYLEYYKSYSDSITTNSMTLQKQVILKPMTLTAKLIIKSYIPEIKRVINHGDGISLSEIRELIQDNENITIHNKQIYSIRRTWKKHTVLHPRQKKSIIIRLIIVRFNCRYYKYDPIIRHDKKHSQVNSYCTKASRL